MFNFADSPKIDGTHWPLAIYFNEYEAALQKLAMAGLLADFANAEDLTADRALTDADWPIQRLTPLTADRDVTLPVVAATNHPFFAVNPAAASFGLVVKSGATELVTLAAGESAKFVSDGVAWHVVSGGGITYPTTAETLPDDIYRCAPAGNASLWTGTISSVSGADVVVTTATGNIVVLTVNSTSQHAKMRLYNTTRSNHALISQTNTGTNTVTLTANAPAGWTAGDSLTIASQTLSSSRSWADLEIVSGVTRSQIFLEITAVSNAATSSPVYVHPLETYSDSKVSLVATPVASITGVATVPFVANSVFAISWTNFATVVLLRYKGFIQ
jgi:hypothetical protein